VASPDARTVPGSAAGVPEPSARSSTPTLAKVVSGGVQTKFSQLCRTRMVWPR